MLAGRPAALRDTVGRGHGGEEEVAAFGDHAGAGPDAADRFKLAQANAQLLQGSRRAVCSGPSSVASIIPAQASSSGSAPPQIITGIRYRRTV